MKPFEILAALDEWRDAPPERTVHSPAWAMPCRLGETQGVLRWDAAAPADTLDLRVRLDGEEHVVSLPDNPRHPDLHALWGTRGDVPENILLALAEKECGEVLQLLEDTMHRELSVEGLAPAGAADGAERLCGRVAAADGTELLSFACTVSPALVETLGQLRHLDLSHPSIRDRAMAAEVEYAAFALQAADRAALVPGGAVMLPELEAAGGGGSPVRLVAEGRFAVAESGVSPWSDDGRCRVLRAEPEQTTFGAVAGVAAGDAAWSDAYGALAQPPPQTALKIVRGGEVLATGRLVQLGGHPAMDIDAAG